MKLAIVTVAAVLALGCGGAAVDEGAPAVPASGAAPGQPASTGEVRLRGADLDFGDKPLVAGFVRFQGSCTTTFRFNLQHPSVWRINAGSLGLHLERAADSTFGIRVGDDMGSVHVAGRLTALKQSGARALGTVTIGGQPVELLVRGSGTYLLFAPHPWGDEGVGYQELIVGSTFGDDVTLQILDSLVPLRC